MSPSLQFVDFHIGVVLAELGCLDSLEAVELCHDQLGPKIGGGSSFEDPVDAAENETEWLDWSPVDFTLEDISSGSECDKYIRILKY